MSQITRILIADDHKVLRRALRRLLEMEAGMEVVGEAEDGPAAVRMAGEMSPDVVIMDISMPNLNGTDSTRQIRAGKINGDGPKVIALSGHAAQQHMSDMLEAGATGYVLKESAFQELAPAVRSVMANQVYLSPRIAETVAQRFRKQGGGGGNVGASDHHRGSGRCYNW